MRENTEQLLKRVAEFERLMKERGIKIVGRSQDNNYDQKKAEIGDPIRFKITVCIE